MLCFRECFSSLFLLILILVLMLQMSTSLQTYIGFVDGACRSTQNLSSAACALFAPDGELIDLQGTCMGGTTNNIAKYSELIELLSEAVAIRIRNLVVKLDSKLVV